MLLSGVVIIELKFFDDDDAIKRYLVEKASIERALEVFLLLFSAKRCPRSFDISTRLSSIL
ncbi:hypothetical protein A1OQ_11875 [Enterovibrio norvegicus FF-162]|uniref:Uncharacterized protein n=1 Tax=Enterovibrio norvegicus FF-454 TaxID=1185651 RepID=A0A1E5C9W7_9GAMM|nr:hypothetical protein A1OK_01835 [Enterovibrio norvegicus FF-454]OEE89234.1 hypothetical protein A1OQ_11875 [Enterovibrio norvegicus FF-162]